MTVGAKMLVNLYGVVALHVVTVLVYAPVALLGFQLAHILPPVGAPVAPGQVEGVF